jgi:hypothetical protein
MIALVLGVAAVLAVEGAARPTPFANEPSLSFKDCEAIKEPVDQANCHLRVVHQQQAAREGSQREAQRRIQEQTDRIQHNKVNFDLITELGAIPADKLEPLPFVPVPPRVGPTPGECTLLRNAAPENATACDRQAVLDSEHAAAIAKTKSDWEKRNQPVFTRIKARQVAEAAAKAAEESAKVAEIHAAHAREIQHKQELYEIAKQPRARQLAMSGLVCREKGKLISATSAIRTEQRNSKRVSGVYDLTLLREMQAQVLDAEERVKWAVNSARRAKVSLQPCTNSKVRRFLACDSGNESDPCLESDDWSTIAQIVVDGDAEEGSLTVE